MKKRIFIAIHYMEIGGAERSLVGLLNAIDTNIYDVDLFIYQHTGEFMAFIPNNINLLPQINKYSTIERPIQDILFEGYIDIALARIIAKFISKRYIRRNNFKDNSSDFQYISNFTTILLPSLFALGEYDLAISYLAPHNIVKDKINAKKKAAWIHTDYSSIQINAELECSVWDSFDNIVAISESTRTTFLKVFPSLEKKVLVIENILSPLFVQEQAKLEDVSSEILFQDGIVRLLSVGRYVKAKNFDNVPYICRNLINEGINIKWYIIGFGVDEELIKRNIEETGMKNNVILLGKKSNPYPYMKACDIYVQPSRYEGKAVTVREAQILNKPVVIANFLTAKSQLKDGFDGVIVPMDNYGMALGLIRFIKDYNLQKIIIKNLHKNDFGNMNEVEKIYNLL